MVEVVWLAARTAQDVPDEEDGRTHIERLRQLLERMEREPRQAAEYALSSLEVNEELQLQVTSLKIQLESDTSQPSGSAARSHVLNLLLQDIERHVTIFDRV
ncbi:hypothetical protein PINS_up020411 [Pythium insidiosum]|nr:hypothetical protein PINS_up020411 [Pythium insidiosum]